MPEHFPRSLNRTAFRCCVLLCVLIVAECRAASDAASSQRAADVATLWHEAKRVRVWALYPVEKLKADEALPVARRAAEITISAARGEDEPFVVVINGESPLREVRLEFSDLAGPDGASISAASLSARRVAYITVDEPSGTRMKQPMPFDTGTGLFPDPLLGGDGALRPGRNLQFWTNVRVPRGIASGIYKGQIIVRFRRETWMAAEAPNELRLALAVRVRGFDLPERSPLLNTAFFNLHALTPGQRDPAWLAPWAAEFVAHRQVPQPALPSPGVKVNKDGSLTVDSDAWEEAAAHLLEGLHAPFIFLPVWATHPSAPMQGLYFISRHSVRAPRPDETNSAHPFCAACSVGPVPCGGVEIRHRHPRAAYQRLGRASRRQPSLCFP
jgi:hypothetical protein